MKKIKLLTSLSSLAIIGSAVPIVATSCSKGDDKKEQKETIDSSSLSSNQTTLSLLVGTDNSAIFTLIPKFYDEDGDEIENVTPEYSFNEIQPTGDVAAFPKDAISFWSNEIIFDASKCNDDNIGIHTIEVSAKAKDQNVTNVGKCELKVFAWPKEINNVILMGDDILLLPNDIDPAVFCGTASSEEIPTYSYTIPLRDGTPKIIDKNNIGNVTSLIITSCKSSVTQLGANFLAGFTNLQEVNLSGLSNIKTIGDNFMAYDVMLPTLDLSSLTGIADGSGIIGSNFLYADASLKKIVLPTLKDNNRILVKASGFMSLCASIGIIEWNKFKLQLEDDDTLPEYFLTNCATINKVDLTSASGAITVDATGATKPIKNFTKGLCNTCIELTTIVCDTVDTPTIKDDGSNFLYKCEKLIGFDKLDKLSFGVDVTEVGDNFLANCSNMNRMTLDMNVLFANNNDTSGFALTKINNNFLKGNNININWFSGWSVYLKLTSVGDSFLEGSQIKANSNAKLDLDFLGWGSLKNIGKYFLRACNGIVNHITIPTLEEGGTIGWDFLGECGNLQSTEESPISLSPLAKVTNIGEGFMYNCHKIEYLDFSPLTSLTTANSFGAGICFGCEKLKSINIGTLSADIFEADVTTQGQEAINFALSTRPAESYAGITVNGDNKAAFIAKFPVKDGPSIWRKLVTAE